MLSKCWAVHLNSCRPCVKQDNAWDPPQTKAKEKGGLTALLTSSHFWEPTSLLARAGNSTALRWVTLVAGCSLRFCFSSLRWAFSAHVLNSCNTAGNSCTVNCSGMQRHDKWFQTSFLWAHTQDKGESPQHLAICWNYLAALEFWLLQHPLKFCWSKIMMYAPRFSYWKLLSYGFKDTFHTPTWFLQTRRNLTSLVQVDKISLVFRLKTLTS